jgi:hypothetical protein
MGKKKHQLGSLMTLARLRLKHAEFEAQLQAALKEVPRDYSKIVELKKHKLLCKDLIDERLKQTAVLAKILPFKKPVKNEPSPHAQFRLRKGRNNHFANG